jgi:phosphoglycolate phosphatase
MTLPKPSLVIFDMDGTTVRHLNPWVLHSLEKADNVLYGTRQILRTVGDQLGLDLRWRGRRSTRKPRLLVHRTLHKLRRKSVEQMVEPCPGIIDLLELLVTHHIPTGLVSNGLGEGYGHDILQKFDLEDLFTATIFREDTNRAKPDPEPLLAILQRLKSDVGPNDVIWYIGDRAKDVVAAMRATTMTPARMVPIGYGLLAVPMLMDQGLGSDHVVLSYEDWYPVVEKILTTSDHKP